MEQEEAYTKIENLLSEAPVLSLYDVNALVVISTDASSKSIGSVLMQNEYPIAYATKAMTTLKQNYP